ncbi:hypothetical protein GGR51DRAFT_531794 [Nemania sp. FL0031]|nr:hypothetical protein GGR51DRAFT_531794 [Nemania sp. FL0031]
MTALNCRPIIETANASVTVDVTSGQVLSYDILEVPRPDDRAWASPFDSYKHNITSFTDPNYSKANTTVSHGVLFVTGLLGAADIDSFRGLNFDTPADSVENLGEQTFNFRESGLNIDYITYAMLSMVDYDHERLLDHDTLTRTAQRTFSVMYQHFVNNNLSVTNGGYAYQSPSEKLPQDIGTKIDTKKRATGSNEPAANSSMVTLHISRPAEILYMSESAAWICVSILAYLIISCIILGIASGDYNRMLIRPVNSLADVAVLVARSDRLLELARYRSVSSIKKDDNIRAQLAWLRNPAGERRWGIELANMGEEK